MFSTLQTEKLLVAGVLAACIAVSVWGMRKYAKRWGRTGDGRAVAGDAFGRRRPGHAHGSSRLDVGDRPRRRRPQLRRRGAVAARRRMNQGASMGCAFFILLVAAVLVLAGLGARAWFGWRRVAAHLTQPRIGPAVGRTRHHAPVGRRQGPSRSRKRSRARWCDVDKCRPWPRRGKSCSPASASDARCGAKNKRAVTEEHVLMGLRDIYKGGGSCQNYSPWTTSSATASRSLPS